MAVMPAAIGAATAAARPPLQYQAVAAVAAGPVLVASMHCRCAVIPRARARGLLTCAFGAQG